MPFRLVCPGLGDCYPCGPFLSTDHSLGMTPCSLTLVCPGLGDCCHPQALLEHRPPQGQDSPSLRAGVPTALGTAAPRMPSLSTDQRLGTTPCPLRLLCPGLGDCCHHRPCLSTDHHKGRTPRPPGLVCPRPWGLLPLEALPKHRPPPRQDSRSPRSVCPGLWDCYRPRALLEHRPPPWHDSPSLEAGVPAPFGLLPPTGPP